MGGDGIGKLGHPARETVSVAANACGLEIREVVPIIEAVLTASGWGSGSAGRRALQARMSVVAGLLDRRYQGCLLRWWWFDRDGPVPFTLAPELRGGR